MVPRDSGYIGVMVWVEGGYDSVKRRTNVCIDQLRQWCLEALGRCIQCSLVVADDCDLDR